MRRGVLKWKEPEAVPLKPVPSTVTPIDESRVRPFAVTPNPHSQHAPSTQHRRRRRKPAPIGNLYREPEPVPRKHARKLLEQIQMYAEDCVGTHVPQSQLERFYGELCTREGWKPRYWTAIGRQLNKLTDRRRLKRNWKQFRAYRIPRR